MLSWKGARDEAASNSSHGRLSAAWVGLQIAPNLPTCKHEVSVSKSEAKNSQQKQTRPQRFAPRHISLSRTGRFAAIRQKDGIDLVDAIGTAPRKAFKLPDVEDFCCVGNKLWVASNQKLRRFKIEKGEECDVPIPFPVGFGRFQAGPGARANTATWNGAAPRLLQEKG